MSSYLIMLFCYHLSLVPGNISVQINTSGSSVLGESGFILTCCVLGADTLPNPFITYQWRKDNGTDQTQIQDGSDPRTVSFHPLRVSDAGRYTCQAIISSAALTNGIVWSASHDVTVLSEFKLKLTPRLSPVPLYMFAISPL